MLKFAVTNYDNGIGTEDFGSREEVVGYCEMLCGGGNCDNLDSQSLENSDHCDRISFHYNIDVRDAKAVNESYCQYDTRGIIKCPKMHAKIRTFRIFYESSLRPAHVSECSMEL